MAFPGRNYAPPGVYTQTRFENPLQGAIDNLRIPVFIGEGNEQLTQTDLEMVRGSSSVVDQRVVGEDAAGRAVTNVSALGIVTRGDFDGILNQIQVRNLPITDGTGRGRITISRADVEVTINGAPVVVTRVDGASGIITLASPPALDDIVRVTYFFNREDTLITDNVSDQVSPLAAVIRASTGIRDVNAPTPGTASLDIHGDILGPNGQVLVAANNVLNLIVDGTRHSIVLTPKANYTIQQLANVITAVGASSLTATRFTNNYGLSALALNSTHDLTVLDGSANALLGLATGSVSTRTRTFYTYQGPIVDGSNGGVTTTDPSHVVVKVNGVQVIPTSVDGASRAVTLPVAPKAGATVTITYWFNSWQDTFDYLAHINVTALTRVGDTPGGNQYTQEADFILQDDKILWGTAALVRSHVTTSGSTLFDDTQVSLTLIDDRTFLSSTAPVLASSGLPSTTDFQLPFLPTLGNGRSTSLGSSLFQTVSNNRIGLPVNRPDVVDAYWGYSVEDALNRGKVAIARVDGSVITLASPVPVGATVFASFYHNRLTDQKFYLQADLIGGSGTGTYTVADEDGIPQLTPTFTPSSKSAGLTGVPVVFPSGSELTPDLHFEGLSGPDFTGPVEEVVTVTFANTTDTPARYTVAGPAPYAFIPGESDLVAMTINGDTVLPASGTSLQGISPMGAGIMAHLVGLEVTYPDGIDFDAADFTGGDEQILLTLDNNLEVTATILEGANQTVSDFAAAINLAASGAKGAADANSATGAANSGDDSLTDAGLTHIGVADYYVGWRIVIGYHSTIGAANPGQVRTVTSQTVDDFLTVDANWTGGAMAATVPYRIYNPDTAPSFKGATRFNGPTDLSTGFRTITVAYNCEGTGGSGTVSASVAATTYATATALATALNTAFRGASGSDITVTPAVGSPIALKIVGDATLAGLDFIFEADADGRLLITPQLPGLSDSGYFCFIPQGSPLNDLALLAGFDTGATHDADQTKLLVGAVARAYRLALGGVYPHDRLILRNRILPGGVSQTAHDSVSQTTLRIGAGSGNAKAGLISGSYGEATHGATVQPAFILARTGFGGGVNSAGEPLVTFYDGTGTQPANNVLDFTLDGTPVRVTFTASDTGTANLLGIAATSGNRIILQIQTAIANLPGAPFGNLSAVQAAGIVRAEGAGIRITSQTYLPSGRIVIGAGSANTALGFLEGATAERILVTAEALASALNSDRSSGANFLLDFTDFATPAAEFAAQAVAYVEQDPAGRKYLGISSAGPASSDYGTGSSITLLNATTRSWLFVGTGVDELPNAGARGDAAINGFYVTSSSSSGSGSVNQSILNAGTGQDGKIGQTYRDAVTGITFTILPRGWHDNRTGPWIAYPSGATLRFDIRSTVTTNANLPVRVIPGVEMTVANTTGISTGDSALVQTFPRGGEEPAIGDIYYVSYEYQKQDFTTRFYTRLASIEAEYGAVHPDNPVSLASYLAMLNGAVLVGVKQVPRAEGSNFATLTSYTDAITELEGVLPGQIRPDLIQPLKGDSTQLLQVLKRSNEIQSSIRYRSERTSIVGLDPGAGEMATRALAASLASDRMRVVYPDMAVINIEEQTADGRLLNKEHLIGGPYLAAMLAGSVVSPNVDVATPWTRRKLVGPSRLGRSLDAVQQNLLAQAGVTVLEDSPPFIRVRHGLTTDMTSVLTKTPTVRLIADYVQQQSRATLDPYIGLKFLPSILSQVEGRLAQMMRTMIRQQIIAQYTGIRAILDPEDPTVANVEGYYQPVFPLLYLVLTYHLRASL